MGRWPTPAGAGRRAARRGGARTGAGSATRAGRCNLHACARAITGEHGGEVPSDHDALLRPARHRRVHRRGGASFAFGGRHAVLDTNVRRVLARAVERRGVPAAATTAAERRLAESLLPDADAPPAGRWR